MFQWIVSNAATLIICAVLLAVISLIIINTVKNKRKGKSSCGCGCSSCPMSDCCHGK